MDLNEDAQLLAALHAADRQAYERVFKTYYKLLLAQAFFYLKDEMEAQDLVQNLFVEIWEKKLYLQINTSVKSYLVRAVHNRSISLLNKQKTQSKRYLEYITDFEEAQEQEPVPTDELDPRLVTVLNELPAQRHQAFQLVYMQNRKYREAADEMGITVNSVKTHLKLALKVLRQKIVNIK